MSVPGGLPRGPIDNSSHRRLPDTSQPDRPSFLHWNGQPAILRNTVSRKDGLYPAQKLFGCPIQDTLPAHRRTFAAEWQTRAEKSERQALATKDATEKSYNQHTHPFPDITIGFHVAIQNQDTKHWHRYGIVVDISRYRRYFIKTGNGRILVRNRRFIRRRVPMSLPGRLHQAPPWTPGRGRCRKLNTHITMTSDYCIIKFHCIMCTLDITC